MTELTREERNRFIAWLNNEVQQERQLLVQIEKQPGFMEAVVRHKRNEIGAYLVVMKRLLPGLIMYIGKQDVGEIEKEQE
jgi:hypothetical protein